MSYRLIDANALTGVISNDDYEKVLNAPCIFADLPNGLDGEHYNLQESKTGHWILADEQNKEDVENDNYRFICSKCQCSDIHAKGTIVPYCWKCGARMVEPQESEG
jgi:hypothetical protein